MAIDSKSNNLNSQLLRLFLTTICFFTVSCAEKSKPDTEELENVVLSELILQMNDPSLVESLLITDLAIASVQTETVEDQSRSKIQLNGMIQSAEKIFNPNGFLSNGIRIIDSDVDPDIGYPFSGEVIYVFEDSGNAKVPRYSRTDIDFPRTFISGFERDYYENAVVSGSKEEDAEKIRIKQAELEKLRRKQEFYDSLAGTWMAITEMQNSRNHGTLRYNFINSNELEKFGHQCRPQSSPRFPDMGTMISLKFEAGKSYPGDILVKLHYKGNVEKYAEMSGNIIFKDNKNFELTIPNTAPMKCWANVDSRKIGVTLWPAHHELDSITLEGIVQGSFIKLTAKTHNRERTTLYREKD